MAVTSMTFDTTYYLNQNPDVLTAILNGSIASAEQHYNLFGYKELRDPNASFDTSYYLTQNPDVLAAGINPFEHFKTFGAAETRAPTEALASAGADFDSTTYLAANPDVQAAVDSGAFANAYQHWVLFGQFEARAAQTTNGTTLTGASSTSGSTFTLTTNSETITGTSGGDTVNGVLNGALSTGSTFGPGDIINGGAGTDTVNVSVSGTLGAAFTSAGFTLTGVENFLVSNFDQAGGFNNTFDMSLATGVSKIGLTSSAAEGDTVFSNVKNSVAVDMQNGAADLTVNYNADVVSGSSDSQAVNLSNLTGGALTINGIENFTVNSATVKSTLGSLVSDKLSKVTVTGDKALTINTALNYQTTDNKGTYDASAATAAQTVSFNTGDTVTVTGSSADDSFDFTTGLDKNDVIDGKDGKDTVKVNADTVDLSTLQMSNVEVFQQESTAGNVISLTTKQEAGLTKVVLVENNTTSIDASVTDLAAGVAVDLASNVDGQAFGIATLGLNDSSGTADALTVNLLGTSGQGAETFEDLAISNIETLNLSSGSFGDTAMLTTDSNVLSDLSGGAGLETLNITGSAYLTLANIGQGGDTTNLKTIDASAFTGNLTATVGAAASALTLTTGSGHDVISMGTNLDATDTLDGGANPADAVDEVSATINGLTATTGALKIANFETIKLNTATAASTINAAGITGATTIAIENDQNVTMTGLAAGVGIQLGTATGGLLDEYTGTLDVSLADETGSADSVTISTIDTNGNDDVSATLKTSSTLETLVLSLAADTDGNNDNDVTFNVSGVASKNVTVKGGETTERVALGTLNTGTTNVDASAFKGVLTATASATATTFTLNGGEVHDVTGGAGNDTFVIKNGAATYNVDGGAGTDSLNIETNGTITETNIDNFETITYTVAAGATAVATTASGKGANDSDATKVVVTGGNSNSSFSIGATNALGAANGSEATGLTTFDASGFAGTLTATFGDSVVDTDLTITGGTGSKDTVTATYEAAATEVLKISAVETINLSVDDGGDDSEAYIFNLASVSGANTIAIAVGAAASDDANTVTFTNVAGGQKFALGYTGKEVFGTTSITATLASAAGTSDALTFKAVDTNNDGDDVSITAAGVENFTLEVDSSGEDHDINLANVSATSGSSGTLTITGGKDDSGGAGSNLEVVNLHSSYTTIDASAYVGTLDITDRGSSAMTITTGTGGDKIAMENGSDVINAGTNTTSQSSDTLDINFTAILGGIQVDLSASGDQVTTFNGSANSAVQQGFENVDLAGYSGSFGAEVTGSSGANTIVSTSNNDVINAGAGADRVTGGDGDDTIDLGASDGASDTVVFGATFAANGTDTITSFVAGSDKIDLNAFETVGALVDLNGATDAWGNGEVFYLFGQAAGAADSSGAAITAINAAAVLTDTANTSWVVISDDNSTAIYEVTGDGGGDEATGDTFNLVGTLDVALAAAGDIVIA